MGIGIAQVAALAGHTVLIGDSDSATLSTVEVRIRRDAERMVDRTDLEGDAKLGFIEATATRVRPSADLDGIAAESDWVIEAIVEDLDAKRQLFRALEPSASTDTVFATNTSALSIAAISAGLRRPENFVGLHFFNPVPLMALVEVVSSARTDPRTADAGTLLVSGWSKRPVQCIDSPGFVVNRINRAFTLEALAMLASGDGDVEYIDGAVRDAGFRMGPFELMDLIGLDVNLAVATSLFEAFLQRQDPLANRFEPSEIHQRLVAEGRLGRKTGRGFYTYPRDVAKPARGAKQASGSSDVATRIVVAIILEAYRALDDDVASRQDIDRAMRLGANHPSGPFERSFEMGGPSSILELSRSLQHFGPRFSVPRSLLADGT